MFTGIVEAQGILRETTYFGQNKTMWFESPISRELRVDQSVSHNGICLTIEEVLDDKHRVTAIAETMVKSNVESWKAGAYINLERCMLMTDRIDGHIVQGHVDTTGRCIGITEKQGSSEYRIHFPKRFAALVIEKGSICLNGISLTAFNVGTDELSVAIIPYTFEYTNMKHLREGEEINIEFDLIGKYIQRWQQIQATKE